MTNPREIKENINESLAILLVSFGSSYGHTSEKALWPIEEQVREVYPQCQVYHAWTSRIIRGKLLERDGKDIPDVAKALEQMREKGIAEVAVQPMFLLKGIEYDCMLADLEAQREFFESIRVGDPLLSSLSDGERIVRILAANLPIGERDCLVMVGHGTEHPANTIYGSLDRYIKGKGFFNTHIGTIESGPTFEDVLAQVRKNEPQRVFLAPLLMVAGEHAHKDLDGADADSWKSRFLAAGFEVECEIRGLGEYPDIRQILVDHLQEAVKGPDGNGPFLEVCK